MNIKSMINNRTSAMMNQRVKLFFQKSIHNNNLVTLNSSKEIKNNQIHN